MATDVAAALLSAASRKGNEFEIAQDSGAAVSAVDGLFFLGDRVRHPRGDEFVQHADEFADTLERYFTVVRHKAEMAHFSKPARQDVLEVAAHKLEDGQRAFLPPLFPGGLIPEGDVGFCCLHDPTRCNGDAEGVLRQIVQRGGAVADVSNVDDPVVFVEIVGQLEASGFELINQLTAIEFGERPGGQIKPVLNWGQSSEISKTEKANIRGPTPCLISM